MLILNGGSIFAGAGSPLQVRLLGKPCGRRGRRPWVTNDRSHPIAQAWLPLCRRAAGCVGEGRRDAAKSPDGEGSRAHQ